MSTAPKVVVPPAIISTAPVLRTVSVDAGFEASFVKLASTGTTSMTNAAYDRHSAGPRPAMW